MYLLSDHARKSVRGLCPIQIAFPKEGLFTFSVGLGIFVSMTITSNM